MAKKKATEKGEPKVVAKCDNLYEVETRRLNEQVNSNIERFPHSVSFLPAKEEFDYLKSQFAITTAMK